MNKMPTSVLNFTAGNEERTKAYAQFAAYVNAYNEGKKSVIGENGEVSFSEANDKVLKFYKAEIEYMSGKKMSDYPLEVYCNFSDVKQAAFAVIGMITDLIIPDALMKDIGMIAEIKSIGMGDSLKIDIQPRDLFVVSKGSRGKRSFDAKRQFKGTYPMIPEPRAITVAIPLYSILYGDYSLAEFVMKAVQSLEVNIRYDIYDAFDTAMNALSTSGDALLKIVGFAQATALGLQQKVQAWNGGKEAVFLGTKIALGSILPASTNFRFDLGSEYVRIGHLRDYFGVKCIELQNVADYATEFKMKLKDTVIYVVSPGADKIVKVAFEGSTLANVGGNYDNADLRVEATLYKSYAVGVYTGSIGGYITL